MTDDRLDELERALRASEAKFRSLMDNAVDGMVIIDQFGKVREFSAAAERIFGYQAAEVVGQGVNMLMPDPDRSAHDGYISRYIETGEAHIIGLGREVVGLRKDGSEFPLELSVAEMSEPGGRHFIGSVRDISGRRDMEARLRQAYKMEALGQLTGGVAHDFNNLLAVLMMDLEILAELTGDDERLAELVAEAREVAQNGADLTHQLLAFSRRQPLRPRAIDLGEMIDGTATMLRRTLGDTIDIDTVAPGELWPTLADPGQIETALLNLALNARDAMPSGGRLTLETANAGIADAAAAEALELTPGDYVSLTVTDTGHGMAPEIAERAFDPFFTTKQETSGSGLGLSMVYGFVKQSGGHVGIDSAPGAGTAITIHLPRAPAGEKATTAPAAAEAAEPGGVETILLVEDHPRLRHRATTVLDALGYTVVAAATGEEALERLAEDDGIALMFTDIVMPGGLSGPETARRAISARPDLKILFTTGYAEHAELQSDLVAGGEALLRKPYSRHDLAVRVRRMLDS
jgi:PAS domain S-box-containing protein